VTPAFELAELTVAGNEASDLLRVHDRALLGELGADEAFWTVLDEGPVEECLALLVHSAPGVGTSDHGSQEVPSSHEHGWWARHVRGDAGPEAGRTEDGEALAYHDGWVYVIGSHFGSKKGPLRPKRAFVARFREGLSPVLQIVRHRFALHRVINDALTGITAPAAADVRERFIGETVRRGLESGKKWVGQLSEADHPVNIEGAAFTSRGTLLLGLRWPVTIDGDPILVEIAGVPGLFEGGGALTVEGVYPITIEAQAVRPVGVRALSARDDGGFDVVAGSIDAIGKGSILLDAHPEARDATCRHYRFELPAGPGAVRPELISDLAPLHHVEGVAQWRGRPLYVTDEDHRVALYRGPEDSAGAGQSPPLSA
jgi:hypothetical protein